MTGTTRSANDDEHLPAFAVAPPRDRLSPYLLQPAVSVPLASSQFVSTPSPLLPERDRALAVAVEGADGADIEDVHEEPVQRRLADVARPLTSQSRNSTPSTMHDSM